MADTTTTIETLKQTVERFITEREWQQFHSPKNLSMALGSEVAELMDFFLWCDNATSYDVLKEERQEIENEIADIAILIFAFCNRHNIDLSAAVTHKYGEAARKYPVEKCKGKYTKYNKL